MTRCIRCEAEGLGSTKVCTNCGTCQRHIRCKCRACGHCNKVDGPKNFCPRCLICRDHHVGKIFEEGEFAHRPCEFNYNPTTPASTFIMNSLPRSLGMEIELGNFGRFSSISSQKNKQFCPYHFDHDGSVMGSGRELVTGKLQGDQYLHSMLWLIKQLQEYKTTANYTCGYHVHVDAIDLGPEHLRRVLIAYCLTQKQLYGTLVAKGRLTTDWGKTYCPPLPLSKDNLLELFDYTESEQINNWFNKYLYQLQYPEESTRKANPSEYKAILLDVQARLKELKAKKYVNSARRSALNFHSWMMRGTIEFRLKEGTTDPTDLLMWPLWCGWFVHKTSSMSDKELMYWFKEAPSLLELAEDWGNDKVLPAPAALVKYIKLSAEAESKRPKDEPQATGEQTTSANETLETAFRNLRRQVNIASYAQAQASLTNNFQNAVGTQYSQMNGLNSASILQSPIPNMSVGQRFYIGNRVHYVDNTGNWRVA